MLRVDRMAVSLLMGCWALASAHAGDTLRLHHVASTDAGALVDGQKEGVAVNDATYTTIDLGSFHGALFPVIPLDNFINADGAHEVIAFTHRRPPALVEEVAWTPGQNAIDVTFGDELLLDVYVWIVRGPFETVSSVAADASVTTSFIWSDERQGIAFESFDIRDATNDPDAGPFLEFVCAEDAAAIKTLIGHVPGALNVYYVNTVDFGAGAATTSGVYCRTDRIIAMGRNTSGHLLAHEFGHAFSLGHTNTDLSHFDTTNVMYNSSSNRRYLTEGQTFRSVFDIDSAINVIYAIRPDEVTRDCPHNGSGVFCPAIYKRIWDDGAGWPPN